MKFIPFGEPMPPVDYEYEPQSSIKEIVNKALNDFYEDIESVICCCMAAGVSADQITMTKPEWLFSGDEARIHCFIGFEGGQQ